MSRDEGLSTPTITYFSRASAGQSKNDANKTGGRRGGAGQGKKVASSPLVSKKLGSGGSQETAKTRTPVSRSNSSAR